MNVKYWTLGNIGDEWMNVMYWKIWNIGDKWMNLMYWKIWNICDEWIYIMYWIYGNIGHEWKKTHVMCWKKKILVRNNWEYWRRVDECHALKKKREYLWRVHTRYVVRDWKYWWRVEERYALNNWEYWGQVDENYVVKNWSYWSRVYTRIVKDLEYWWRVDKPYTVKDWKYWWRVNKRYVLKEQVVSEEDGRGRRWVWRKRSVRYWGYQYSSLSSPLLHVNGDHIKGRLGRRSPGRPPRLSHNSWALL